MIPPIAPSSLSANTNFARLHQHLCKHVLGPDASTRQLNGQHESTEERLRARRSDLAQNRLLMSALFQIVSHDSLPKDLQDVVLVVASYIADAARLGLSDEEHQLIREDVTAFQRRLVQVTTALSVYVKDQSRVVTSIASETTHSQQSEIHSRAHSGDLSLLIESQISHLQQLKDHDLPKSLYETTNSLISLLQDQSDHLQLLIRHLEQRKHGSDARHLTAHAQFLSTVAQGLEAKAKVTYLERRRDLYSPELRQALFKQSRALEKEDDKLKKRTKELQTALKEYEDAGGEVMSTLGRTYGDVEREIDEVKRDVYQLKDLDT